MFNIWMQMHTGERINNNRAIAINNRVTECLQLCVPTEHASVISSQGKPAKLVDLLKRVVAPAWKIFYIWNYNNQLHSA